MKAYQADPPCDDRHARAEATCEYYLPWLKCDVCEQDWRALGRVPPTNPSPWSESEVWYPSFKIAKRADLTKFAEDDTVTLRELESMRKEIIGKGARNSRYPPGSGIGPVRAKLPGRPTDFLWCSFKLLASRRALDAFADAGILLPHGPVVSSSKGAKADFVALQLDPVPLYSKQTLTEMTLGCCPACGQFWMRNVRAKCCGPKQYVRSRSNEKHGLVKVVEGFETLATEAFMEVAKSKKLSGIEFTESGIYV